MNLYGQTKAGKERTLLMLQMMADSVPEKEIGKRLHIKPRTIQSIVAQMMETNNCTSRFAVVIKALRNGYIK